jgi:DNA-binding response OmpR family regulator
LSGNGLMLVADYYPDIALFLNKALYNYGFETTAFNDAQEPLINFKANLYDLIN